MKQLLLIDANSIIHRSFHAIPPFTGPSGEPTGALYGIASILLKLWKEDKPNYVAALFDRPEPTFRKKMYEAYKAQRPPAPDVLISQIIEAHRLFEAFGIRTFEKAGFEADDLIATFAEKFKKENDLQVVILTGDRDTLQMVEGDRLVVRTFNKGVSDTTTYDEKTVIEKYGLSPRQMVDYKSLVGDPSDNIKGVQGIGPKTATELVQRYGDIDTMYREAEHDEKLKRKLGDSKKEAEFSRKLVVLERHVPLEMPPIEDLAICPDDDSVEMYFEKKRICNSIEENTKKRKIQRAPQKSSGSNVLGRVDPRHF